VGLFSASCASGFILLPGLSANAGGLPWLQAAVGGGGNGGAGAGGSGGGGGGGGGAGGPHNPLYDLSAAQQPQPEDDDASSLTEEAPAAADADAGKPQRSWADLITPSDELDEAPEGQRSGTNRCVEVVIEGWPSLGSLPKKVHVWGHTALAGELHDW
jgi:hypothetical protein